MTRGILHQLGFIGHYLHVHTGGRGGKQFILCTLHKSGGHVTQRELIELSGISPSALSEVLAKLEAEGLIVRSPNPQDRRQLTIELTDLGTQRAATIHEERLVFESQALACFTEEEKAELEELLATLEKHWETLRLNEEVGA